MKLSTKTAKYILIKSFKLKIDVPIGMNKCNIGIIKTSGDTHVA